ncbi:MAG TPA: hypothetical protein VK640_06420 [Actinomycetes bacterium]|nr:hypothetical protein [Actinomycetes bacterium]
MASGTVQNSGIAAMSVETCVVTPSIRLDGTKARATQPSRVRKVGAGSLPTGAAGSADDVPAGSADDVPAGTVPGAPVSPPADVRRAAAPAVTPHATTSATKPT